MHLLKHLYFQHTSHQSSQNEWWVCQVHLSLPPLLYVDLISLFPKADIFYFLLVSWPPPGPVLNPSEAQLFTAQRALCAVNMVVWVSTGTITHMQKPTHTHTHTLKLYPQSHDNPRWVAEMFAMLQSLCPAELTVTDRNKQNTDIHDPDLCQRVQTVTTEKRMVQQIQPKWKLQQLFCGHDKDEPDSHLDPPKNDQKINITSGKMKGWYICLCKAQNGF